MKKTEYQKLSPLAKTFADSNEFFSDEKIKEIAKQIRICARLEWGVKRDVYSKWSISTLFEKQIEQNKLNPIGGFLP